MKLFIKETGSISVGGVEYTADENGIFEVPSEVFNHLVGEDSHNIEIVLPEAEAPKEEEIEEEKQEEVQEEKSEEPKQEEAPKASKKKK